MNEREFTMDERRSSGRTRISKPASLFFAGQSGERACDVNLTDLTDGGAGIRKPGLALLPVAFEISFDNLRRKCRLVWRKGNFFGVAFENLGPPSSQEPPQVIEQEAFIPMPAFSILHDQPYLAGAQDDDVWAEFSSSVGDKKDQGQADLRFMIGVAIALTLPVLISLGTYMLQRVWS
jgi:hypothetical protein